MDAFPLRPPELGRVGRAPALRLVAEACCLGLLPALFVAGALVQAATVEGAMVDLADYREAADRMVRGESPYPDDARLAGGGGYLYPPFFAWLVSPLLLVSSLGAQVVFTVLSVAAVVLALVLLGVRDWRCFGAALLGAPLLYSLNLGTAVPFLMLGVAGAWWLRERRPRAGGVLLGLLLAAKPFTWPLLAWPLARGRYPLTLWAAAAAAAAVVASWAAIGFAGLGEYVDLLRRVTEQRAAESYSFAALLTTFGLSVTVAAAAALAVGAAVVGVAFRGRRGREELVLILCLAAAIAASPIVWSHYFVLLLVPIALMRPRFGPLWLVPVAMHALPDPAWTGGEPATIAPLLLAATLTLAYLAWSPRARSPR